MSAQKTRGSKNKNNIALGEGGGEEGQDTIRSGNYLIMLYEFDANLYLVAPLKCFARYILCLTSIYFFGLDLSTYFCPRL